MSNIHFLVEKYTLMKKKDGSIFSDILMSQWRYKVMHPFSAYLRLESGVLWFPAGVNMYYLFIRGYITDVLLILEHRMDWKISRGYISFKMMSVQEKMTSLPKWKVCYNKSSNRIRLLLETIPSTPHSRKNIVHNKIWNYIIQHVKWHTLALWPTTNTHVNYFTL